MRLHTKLQPYQYFFLLFIASLLLYLLGILRVQSIFWGDSLYYYAYTRSIVIDQDIDFSNQAFHSELGFPNPAEVSPLTGRVTNKFSPGTALFWIPGMVLGQIVSYVGNLVVGSEVFIVDGTGKVPQFFVAITALLLSISGLWFTYKTLTEWFNKEIGVLSVGALFLNTPLFYYTAVDPVNSHSISFFLSSFLLYQFSRVLKTEISWQRVIPLGVTAGFLILVRNQDVVIAAPVLCALLLIEKRSLLHKLNWATLFMGSAFLIFSVQIYTTISLFGILGSPYLIRGEKISWLQPDFFRVLFTLENGLFFFAPLLGIAVICLAYAVQHWRKKVEKNKIMPLFLVSLAVFLLQLYVVASWGAEIIGGPYGSRMFVSTLPFLSIGIGFLMRLLQKKFHSKKLYLFYFICVTLFFLNMLVQTMWMLYRF